MLKEAHSAVRKKLRWPFVVGLLVSLLPLATVLPLAPLVSSGNIVFPAAVAAAALLPVAFAILWRYGLRALPDREIGIRMGLLAASLATGLLLAEGALRLLGPPSVDDPRNKAVNAPDGTYWYYKTYFRDGRDLATSWGFLGDEPVAGQQVNVLALGDSLPAAVRPDNFVIVADALLAADGGRAVKIHNVSFAGYSLDQIRRFYQERLDGLPQDFVVLMLYIDDVNRELRYQKNNRLYNPIVPEWLQTFFYNCEVTALVFHALGQNRVPIMQLRRFSYEERLEDALRVIGEIKQTAESRGARFAIFNIPRFNWSGDLGAVENYRYASFNARFEAWARSKDVPYYDLTPAFVGQPVESLRISWLDIHFSPKGHELVGQHLARFLREVIPAQ